MSEKTGEDAEAPGGAMRHRELLKWLADIEQTLEGHGDVVQADAPNMHAFRELAKSVRNDGRSLLEDGRLLRLGVIGQMKAGKSSLLNSLLFDGREVLPKAATPMTASLTHIVKSGRDEVEIEYYSRSEWDEIEKLADHYRKNFLDRRHPGGGVKNGAVMLTGGSSALPLLRASHELVKMAKDKGIDVDCHLDGRGRHPASVDTLNQTLRDLVGAEGELTPLVKSVTIECSQGIPEIDIVDTPGINDPIVSRSRETNRLLGRCDAVLLLSYAGQFMDSVDAEFFQKRVSAEGITRRLLLASKFDSALIDVAKDHPRDLEDAMLDVQNRLASHAVDALRRTAADGEGIRVNEGDILFVSPMCAALSRKPADDWLEDEREAFENLRKAYPDWLDQVACTANEQTGANLRRIGGQERVTEKLAAIRHDKEEIIEKRMEGFLREKRRNVERELEEIDEDLRGRRDALRDGDLAKHKALITKLRETIEGLEDDIEETWRDVVDNQRRYFHKLSDEIREEANEARKEVKGAVSKERRRKSKGYWLPILARMVGLDTHKEYEARVVDKAQLQQAVEDFSDNVQNKFNEVAREAFSRSMERSAMEQLSGIICDKLSNEIASGMNINLVKRTLRETIGGICRSARENIQNKRNSLLAPDTSGVDSLRAGREAIKTLADQITEWADREDQLVNTAMDQARSILTPISKTLETNVERLEGEYAEREFKLQRYDLAVVAIKGCIEVAPR